MKRFVIFTLLLFVFPVTLFSGWIEQESPYTDGRVNDIYFVSSTIGFMACGGSNVPILKTTNGGTDWIEQTNPTRFGLKGVFFISSTVGWIVAEREIILYTSDGGSNWEYQHSDTVSGNHLNDLHFINSTTGWAVGASNHIFYTTNGGSNWSSQDGNTTSNLYGIHMISLTTGWICGTNGVILKTTNSGSTWSNQTSGTTESLYDIQFLNSNVGFVIGNNGIIRKTTDGGSSWFSQNSGTSNQLWDIHLTDSDIGWCCGRNGEIIKTTNGGDNWSTSEIATTVELRSIFFTTSNLGYVAGANGIIYKFSEVLELSPKEISKLSYTSSESGGNITYDGALPITAKGVVWSTTNNPILGSNELGHTSDGTGSDDFTSSIAGLDEGITYYVRAYATRTSGTKYGDLKTFTTLTKTAPVVTTTDITDIMDKTAESGGNVSDDGGEDVTDRGVVWSIEENPELGSNEVGHTSDGTGEGSFTSEITGLNDTTTYYLKAYATNSIGTSYGDQKEFTTFSKPTVTTADVTDIGLYTASCGGNVLSDAGTPVIERGIVWSDKTAPELESNEIGHKTAGKGTGTFTGQISDLEDHEKYYVRAYAINKVGTSYGEELEFITQTFPTVSTTKITEITFESAESGGRVTEDGGSDIQDRGIVWSTDSLPSLDSNETGRTDDGDGRGTFTSELEDLEESTTYFVRAYASNEVATGYGDELEFTTMQKLATVVLVEVRDIGGRSAKADAIVEKIGSAKVSRRGVVWSTTSEPELGTNELGHIDNGIGLGNYTCDITELTEATTYYVRAYAENSHGIAYSDEMEFTTPSIPTVLTAGVTEIDFTTAVSGGNVIADGGLEVTERGVVWSETENPKLTANELDHTSDGSGTGEYTSSVSGLSSGKVYYIRAYATNGNGTGYGEAIKFETKSNKPLVITLEATDIGISSAKVGGEVTYGGDSEVTERGVVWGLTNDPELSVNEIGHTNDGEGLGVFSSMINDLNENTKYYYKAYATNENGISYGEEKEFTTLILSVGDEIEGLSINIFPNPVESKLHFQLSMDDAREIEIRIVDILGIERFRMSEGFTNSINKSIDTQNLNSGTYFIEIRAGSDIIHRNFVKR